MSWRNTQTETRLRALTEQPDGCSAVAVIIIDSGFSCKSISSVRNLLGYWDLNSDFKVLGPGLKSQQGRSASLAEIVAFAASQGGDPLNHGSIVLEHLLADEPELPVVLVRAFDVSGTAIKTGFLEGRVSRPGWTDGYLWAQAVCLEQGYLTVANCSFGSFHHAMDGSGWESFQLGRVIGAGKAGPISFRVPELSLVLARYLACHPELDAADARRLLPRTN
ncbi:MAG: hypothetical protein KGS72_14815 [Cyanobacteria bacterium REEB67]|nr:hypothetical protein [Cyanobacteria bacterium REEB67]